MIRVEHLAKSFATALPLQERLRFKKTSVAPRKVAVADVSFDAPNGQITGLLGPNGAGKTTTLRMLAGLITPDSGRVEVDGQPVQPNPLPVLARLGILSDARGLYPRLTARENIVYYGTLHGLTRDAAQARADELAELLDLKDLMPRRADGFSQGERMKTALARTLIHNPPNLLLDEPTNGLDVVATRALREVLRHLRSPAGGGKCIVLSTHIMQEVERLCDAVYIVSHGRTVAHGTVDELLAQTGQRDFEEAFVQLAFAPAASPPWDTNFSAPVAARPAATPTALTPQEPRP